MRTPPRAVPRGRPSTSFAPPTDAATFRDLLLFEERLKSNALALRRRKSRYQCQCFSDTFESKILTDGQSRLSAPAAHCHRVPSRRSPPLARYALHALRVPPGPSPAGDILSGSPEQGWRETLSASCVCVRLTDGQHRHPRPLLRQWALYGEGCVRKPVCILLPDVHALPLLDAIFPRQSIPCCSNPVTPYTFLALGTRC
jgi:hypothetical protein